MLKHFKGRTDEKQGGDSSFDLNVSFHMMFVYSLLVEFLNPTSLPCPLSVELSLKGKLDFFVICFSMKLMLPSEMQQVPFWVLALMIALQK